MNCRDCGEPNPNSVMAYCRACRMKWKHNLERNKQAKRRRFESVR